MKNKQPTKILLCFLFIFLVSTDVMASTNLAIKEKIFNSLNNLSLTEEQTKTLKHKSNELIQTYLVPIILKLQEKYLNSSSLQDIQQYLISHSNEPKLIENPQFITFLIIFGILFFIVIIIALISIPFIKQKLESFFKSGSGSQPEFIGVLKEYFEIIMTERSSDACKQVHKIKSTINSVHTTINVYKDWRDYTIDEAINCVQTYKDTVSEFNHEAYYNVLLTLQYMLDEKDSTQASVVNSGNTILHAMNKLNKNFPELKDFLFEEYQILDVLDFPTDETDYWKILSYVDPKRFVEIAKEIVNPDQNFFSYLMDSEQESYNYRYFLKPTYFIGLLDLLELDVSAHYEGKNSEYDRFCAFEKFLQTPKPQIYSSSGIVKLFPLSAICSLKKEKLSSATSKTVLNGGTLKLNSESDTILETIARRFSRKLLDKEDWFEALLGKSSLNTFETFLGKNWFEKLETLYGKNWFVMVYRKSWFEMFTETLNEKKLRIHFRFVITTQPLTHPSSVAADKALLVKFLNALHGCFSEDPTTAEYKKREGTCFLLARYYAKNLDCFMTTQDLPPASEVLVGKFAGDKCQKLLEELETLSLQ